MKRKFFQFRKKREQTFTLHETYIDQATAGEEFLLQHAEGRLVRAVSIRQMYLLWTIIASAALGILFRVWYLQITTGEEHVYISENNVFAKEVVLPVRGTIYDRNGVQIAWNTEQSDSEVPARRYRDGGFSALIGFIKYPQKDSNGVYFETETRGETGIEKMYNHLLAGRSGSLVSEKNVAGDVLSELYIEEQENGENIEISVDAEIQGILFDAIKKIAEERDFDAGSGTLMDIHTGEILALTSYPEFDNNAMTNLSGEERKMYVQSQDNGVFVHRGISGLYGPGSTVKPFFAIAALESGIITPEKIIVSTGSLSIKNPYNPDIVYTYNDWKPHGPITMYDAIAQSSNVYFYYIGGGYGNFNGLGIDRLKTYASIFGLGVPTSLGFFNEPSGLVPDPKWKQEKYGEDWSVGDTYNTVIGQYDFQVTPLQLARATAAIANDGFFTEPHFNKGKSSQKRKIAISDESISVAKKSMRRSVTHGIGEKLRTEEYSVAVKTGTAQVGSKGVVNSLLIGFFPYERPKYAFAIVMERGREKGATTVGRLLLDGIFQKRPEYMKIE